MITKEEFETLWNTGTCLAESCTSCNAGQKNTPKDVLKRFLTKYENVSPKSICTMIGWFRSYKTKRDAIRFFFNKQHKFEDI